MLRELGLWPAAGAYAALWLAVLLSTRRRHLPADPGRQHVLGAAAVAVMTLWLVRAPVEIGYGLHFLGLPALTLILGGRLALLVSILPVLAAVLVGGQPWPAAGLEGLCLAALPVAVVYGVWRLTERFLPPHLFVYIFVCGFFGAVLATLVGRLGLVGLLRLAEPAATPDGLDFMLLPLTALPEGVINGMAISVLVVYRPDWVRTFDSRRYLGP